jgi:hypothetical protein
MTVLIYRVWSVDKIGNVIDEGCTQGARAGWLFGSQAPFPKCLQDVQMC